MLYDICLDLWARIDLRKLDRQVHSVHATLSGDQPEQVFPRFLGKLGDPCLQIRTEDSWAKTWRDTQGRDQCLPVAARCERPNLRSKFGPAGYDHKTYRAIQRARSVPTFCKCHHVGANEVPHVGRRTIDHLGCQHGINRQSETYSLRDNFATSLLA